MLYLLFVLTFLAGILFYGMSPRDDRLQMDEHQAEGMIISFLAQHQAAKDYLFTWLGAGPDSGSISNVKNDNFLKAEVDINTKKATTFNFEQMTPYGATSDMCAGNQGVPGENTCQDEEGGQIPGFVSRVVCLKTDGSKVDDCTDNSVTKRYVITYGGWEECTDADVAKNVCAKPYKRPNWWPREGQRMRKFESWRKAIANRTRGSISCGTLVEVKTNKWCIDNGETVYKNENASARTCMTEVPSAVINAMPDAYRNNNAGLDDLLFCMSEFKQGLGNYVSGVEHFYDGLANAGFGQHQTGNGETWADLAGTDNISSQKLTEKPYIALTGGNAVLNTGLSLNGDYTITILAKVDSATGTFALFSGSDTGSDISVFEWQQTCSCEGLDEGCYFFRRVAESGTDADCFTTTHSGIISWSFVVENCPSDGAYSSTDKCMSVYENAVRRIIRKKGTFNGNLKIGTNGANPGADIYGIQYYNSALSDKEIQQNFKVDQKRFGIADVNNGGLMETRKVTDATRSGGA